MQSKQKLAEEYNNICNLRDPCKRWSRCHKIVAFSRLFWPWRGKIWK